MGTEFEQAPDLPGRRDPVLRLDVRVMTVLYGGGVEPGQPDPLTPFRGSSIRGHLRFWWRATRGAAFTSWEELRAREGQIWGDTERASGVRLRVLNADLGSPVDPRQTVPYALFPAVERDHRVYRDGRFVLELTAEAECVKDVNAALWAWFTFGGIGARTRRGAGALCCSDFVARQPIEDWLRGWAQTACLGNGTARDWPTLKGATVILGERPSDWNACWGRCVGILRGFRQQGRRVWPEADEIRRRRRRQAGKPVNPRHDFPRAALGLPIVFEFKEGADPRTNTLETEYEGGRMGSPVILRPVAVSERQAVPLLLAFQAAKMPGLKLKQKDAEELRVEQGGQNVVGELVTWAADEWGTEAFAL